MSRYIVRRTLFLVLVLFVVSVLTFVIFVKLPASDPARRAVGRQITPQQLAAARTAFGLDKPIWVQYWRFAKGLIPWPGLWLNKEVYFDWGNFVPVSEEIARALPVTLMLAIGTAVVWLLIGIPIGILSGIKPGTRTDKVAMLFALLGVSAPDFWIAYVFLFVFWFKLHIAPPSGIPIGEGVWQAALEGRFVMPWIVLASTFAAFYARMVRGSLIETMSEDYIRTARAKGMSERRVILKHGLRAALTPTVTMFGLDLADLLGGAFIVETVFNLPGVGRLAVQAVYTNDFPVVMGVTLLGTFFIAVANLVVDVTYAWLDPRVRFT
ncbi:MAG TPA: ABC transporter permease [Actinomycetota bacterium]